MEPGLLKPDELKAQIRYALSGLRARNGHHEFEEACRHLARARIAPNILPATGPVSAGGDQGIDFETFHSYLSERLGDTGWFAGCVLAGPIAFICTLQRGSVVGKIRNDVAKICAAPTRPDRIYAFIEEDLPVSKRHGLIERVKDQYGIELEVFDGNAIAEHLADHDTYWIAVQYLKLPEDFAPVRPPTDEGGQPAWYTELVAVWKDSGAPRPALSVLFELRDGLRHATFDPAARGDLPMWLDLVRPLADQDGDGEVQQRARYELIVASIRGLGDLHDVDGYVDTFLRDAQHVVEPARLEDASIVLSYASTAAAVGHSSLELAALAEHRRALRQRAAELLDEDPPHVRRTHLLRVAGLLALTPDGGRMARAERRAPSPVADLDRPAPAVAAPDAAGMAAVTDVDDALRHWTALAKLIADTPLFPVDDFARLVQFLTPVLVDGDGWRQLTDALDSAIARVAGGDRAGQVARNRSIALADAGRALDALHEMHRAKVEWWTGDTFEGALLAMAYIARLYRELRMPFAAKQYALAIAAGASTSGQDELADFVPSGMLLASEMSYYAGDWLAALEEIEIGIMALHSLGQQGSQRAGDLAERATFHAARCLHAVRDLAPELREPVERALRSCGLYQPVSAAIEGAPPVSKDEWRERCDRDMLGRPFADAGERYAARFSALGTRWTLSCDNEYGPVRATQRLAAALQITLVELAAADLCLMPTAIDVDVVVTRHWSGPSDMRAQSVPSNDGRHWRVQMTDFAEEADIDTDAGVEELLSTILRLLIDVSLLPHDDYFAVVEHAFERGLMHKLATGRLYDELAGIVQSERFAATDRTRYASPLTVPPPPLEHPQLAWQSGPGPGFSEGRAREMAANRYDKITELLPTTLARLRSDGGFHNLVERLRGEGWFDWHILVGVYNVAANFRLGEAGLNTYETATTAAGRRAAQELTQTEAIERGAPIPMNTFSEAAIRQSRRAGLIPLILNWGLRSRQTTPDYPAVERVLAARYGYWDIDAEHENVL